METKVKKNQLALPPVATGANLPATIPEKTNTAPKDEKTNLTIDAADDETDDQAMARARMHPVTRAAITMLNFTPDLKKVGISAIVGEMATHVNAVKDDNMNRPEAMLVCQAQTLDTIFNEMAAMAAANMQKGYKDATEQYLRMALKAQVQCRATIETLAEVKNPRSATFVKQQNVAHQQQVNNGVPAPITSAHGQEKVIASNELLGGVEHGKRMDRGAAGATGSGDPQLAAVEPVDRAENKRGKGGQQPKRTAARSSVG